MAPDIGMILKNIAEYKATMFFAPPTVWIAMLHHPDFDKYDLSSLVKCYYGASIMPREILRELLEKFPKAGGENVASREVEEAVYLHPDVEEVAAVGVYHPKWVEAVVTVIIEINRGQA